MKKLFRLLRRIGAIVSTAFFTLNQYRKISKKYKDDKEGYIKASQELSQQTWTRIKDAANVEIVLKGAPIHQGPSFYLSNHMSFMDAAVLGSLVKTSFISKAETEKQMFVGPMLRALSTTFIERTSDDLPRIRKVMAKKVSDGRNISWYPEATTTDGSFVLPFRAGLLQTLFNEEAKASGYEGLPKELRVQAFTMRLTHVNDIDLEANREETQHLRDIFTNHIGGSKNGVFNEMLHTFKYMSTIRNARVEMIAHEPINPFEHTDGKSIVNAAWQQAAPAIIENVEPNKKLFDLYREGRTGWKAPSPKLMDACWGEHVKIRDKAVTPAPQA